MVGMPAVLAILVVGDILVVEKEVVDVVGEAIGDTVDVDAIVLVTIVLEDVLVVVLS